MLQNSNLFVISKMAGCSVFTCLCQCLPESKTIKKHRQNCVRLCSRLKKFWVLKTLRRQIASFWRCWLVCLAGQKKMCRWMILGKMQALQMYWHSRFIGHSKHFKSVDMLAVQVANGLAYIIFVSRHLINQNQLSFHLGREKKAKSR